MGANMSLIPCTYPNSDNKIISTTYMQRQVYTKTAKFAKVAIFSELHYDTIIFQYFLLLGSPLIFQY